MKTLLRSADTHLDLAGIIGGSIESRIVSAVGYSDHFFEIEVHNVLRHRGDRLLNAIDVSRYLGQVISVAFHPDFTFGDESPHT